MPSLHAVLSASSSNRWIHCTPSARLEEHVTEKASIYSAEGTLAHSKAEEKLRNYVEGHPRRKVKCEDGEMDECTTAYRDYVIEVLNTEKKTCEDAKLDIEVQLDLTPWIPEGFGTSDAVIVSDNTLHVIDLKYGKGVPVYAPHNSQLLIYAAGALHEYEAYYAFDKVKMHIFQPRLDHISTYEISTVDLCDYMENVIKPAAKKAWDGQGEQEAGKWCQFCKVKANCKERAKMNIAIAEQNKLYDAMLLTDDEVASLLPRLSEMKKWCADIEEFALNQALSGVHYKGYKVVEGRSSRKIVDADSVQKLLIDEGFKEDEFLKPKELLSITDLEKLVGKKKFTELASPYINKPEGKPTLVEESDKRPSIVKTGVEDFQDEVQ